MYSLKKQVLIISIAVPTSLFVGCKNDNDKKLTGNTELSKNKGNKNNQSSNAVKRLAKNEDTVMAIFTKMQNGPNSEKKVKIELTSNLKNDFNMDSLDMVELVMNLEDTFDVAIDVDANELSKWITVSDVIKYIDNHTKK